MFSHSLSLLRRYDLAQPTIGFGRLCTVVDYVKLWEETHANG